MDWLNQDLDVYAEEAHGSLEDLGVSTGEMPKTLVTPYTEGSHGDRAVTYIGRNDTLVFNMIPDGSFDDDTEALFVSEIIETLASAYGSKRDVEVFDSEYYAAFKDRVELLPEDYRPEIPESEDLGELYAVCELMRERGNRVRSIFTAAENEMDRWINTYNDAVTPLDLLDRRLFDQDEYRPDEYIHLLNSAADGSERVLEHLQQEDSIVYKIAERKGIEPKKIAHLLERAEDNIDEINTSINRVEKASEHLEAALDYEREQLTSVEDPVLMAISTLVAPASNGTLDQIAEEPEAHVERIEDRHEETTVGTVQVLLENMDPHSKENAQDLLADSLDSLEE